MFMLRNIHKHSFADAKNHNQIDHVLMQRRWDSSTLKVRSFRGGDCDTDHYLLDANVRERLAVSK